MFDSQKLVNARERIGVLTAKFTNPAATLRFGELAPQFIRCPPASLGSTHARLLA
jgi:hypothetical protein